MSANNHSGSAKIYQFPLSPRFAAKHLQPERKAANDAKPSRMPDVVYAGSWYHEAAIRDAERARKI